MYDRPSYGETHKLPDDVARASAFGGMTEIPTIRSDIYAAAAFNLHEGQHVDEALSQIIRTPLRNVQILCSEWDNLTIYAKGFGGTCAYDFDSVKIVRV